jgi:uncharacterized damage-inducible protein DinB
METLGSLYLKELEAEATATRKCLQNVADNLFDWKPHEKSLNMLYLAMIVAEIPKWITKMVEQQELDFVTFEHFQPKTTADLVKHFDDNMEGARKALSKITDEQMEEPFSLKANGQLIMTTPKKDNIGPSINHQIHHRGQLTVYLRLNNLPVPSIYGPSADDKGF